MSARAICWLLFGSLVLALPFPMLGPFEALVPPVRYAILPGAADALALAEGAAGPVSLILGLLALNLLLSLAAAGIAAWIASRALGALRSPALRSGLAVGVVCAGLAIAASLPIYEMAFGRSPTANLLGVLR
jgi:hypothetical protein